VVSQLALAQEAEGEIQHYSSLLLPLKEEGSLGAFFSSSPQFNRLLSLELQCNRRLAAHLDEVQRAEEGDPSIVLREIRDLQDNVNRLSALLQKKAFLLSEGSAEGMHALEDVESEALGAQEFSFLFCGDAVRQSEEQEGELQRLQCHLRDAEFEILELRDLLDFTVAELADASQQLKQKELALASTRYLLDEMYAEDQESVKILDEKHLLGSLGASFSLKEVSTQLSRMLTVPPPPLPLSSPLLLLFFFLTL